MDLNAEGFVGKVLLEEHLSTLNNILKGHHEGISTISALYNYAVPYGLSLTKLKRCIEHCLNQTSKFLSKPIEQIEDFNLKNLLDQEDLEALKSEMIKFTKLIFVNHSDEFRDPNDLNCEKITRLNIAMRNFDMQDKLSNVFSYLVIDQTSDFFRYIIDENKINEINFIGNMIDNLSLDNITDDTSTKFAKLVIFLNDFMFRKNNSIKFIDGSFDYFIISFKNDWSFWEASALVINYNVNQQAIEKYAKFLLDNLQLILEPIDLNSDKKINELLDSVKLNTLKEKAITFIKDYGPGFYDYKRIEKQYLNRFNFNCSESDYFNNDFFDIETPIYLISNERIKQVEQTAKTNILINYFNWLSNKNQSKIFPSGIENISPFLNKISNVNYDPAAINFILNFNSTKNLLSKIDQPEVTITVDEVYNFLIDFNKNFSNIIYPIPQQENSIVQQNSK